MVLGLLTATVSSAVWTAVSNPLLAWAAYVAFYVFGDFYSTRYAVRRGQTEQNTDVREVLESGGWDALWQKKLKTTGVLAATFVALSWYTATQVAAFIPALWAGVGLFATVANVSAVYAKGNNDMEPTYPYSEAP